MKLSILSKIVISYPLLKLGLISRRIRSYTGEHFFILMYHRILPPNKVNRKIQPGMYVFDTTFARHLRFLKKHFAVVPLNELIYKGCSGLESNGKPLCCLTFDDGWADFYDYAYPLLKSSNVPATVFLPTNYISSSKMFWTDLLADLLENGIILKTRNVVNYSSVGNTVSRINTLNGSFEQKLEYAVENLKKYPQDMIEKILVNSLESGHLLQRNNDKVFLTWEQVREMKDSGLITFGSHTCTHRILTTLNEQEVYNELNESKRKLIKEDACDEDFVPFCYPNGNFNEKIALIVRETGYHMAVTTQNGLNSFGDNLFSLRRIGIHQDMTSTAPMFASRIAGVI